MEHEGLGRLEQIVEKMLVQFAGLKQEKERLEYDLLQKEREINELREMTTNLQGEKNMIHERVSSLLSSLERWEESHGRPPQPPNNTAEAGEQRLNFPKSPEGLEAGIRG